MTRWIAFLRAVNVGGRTVSMPVVREDLSASGFADVATFLASGNVFITTPARRSQRSIEGAIEGMLLERCGFEVPTMVRRLDDVKETLTASLFPATPPEGDLRRLVLFAKSPVATPPLPWALPGDAGIVVGAGPQELFVEMTVGKRVPNPAAAVEKELGVAVTGRFGHTLHKIVAAATTPR